MQHIHPNSLVTLKIPLIPIRESCLPLSSIIVGRKKSMGSFALSWSKDRYIALFTQKTHDNDLPKEKDLNKIGSVFKILRRIKIPGKKVILELEGVSCVQMLRFYDEEEAMYADVKIIHDNEEILKKPIDKLP